MVTQKDLKRGYSLKFIDVDEIYNNPMEFMKGCTILEARGNTGNSFISNPHSTSDDDYGFNIIMDNPSFLLERDGKHYIIAILPALSDWSVFEVNYIDNKKIKWFK